MPHLLVALTAHGFGHVAQTAPVINALRRRFPALRLTLYTDIPRKLLVKRFEGEFELIARAPDVGLRMKHALEVDVAASARAYKHYHRDWQQAVAAEARLLTSHAPDAVLANVPYRILAAAAQADIPALAMCSLNWADVYGHYCGQLPGATSILAEMRTAYRTARAFLQPAPSMPMPDLDNISAIGPIARLGNDLRDTIRRRLDLPDAAQLLLVSLGGVPMQLNPADWPAYRDMYWVVPAAWDPQRRDTIAFESLAMNFVDVMRSADALITKPGYGNFVEAACNGVPILYVPRPDWPEQDYLVNWLQRHGRCLAIDRDQLYQGKLVTALEELFSLPPREPATPTGINDAVEQIITLLGCG